VLLVVSSVLVLFVVLVPLAIAARCETQLATDCHSKDGASMMVTAMPRHPTMCVYSDSSHPSRTRSPDIARKW